MEIETQLSEDGQELTLSLLGKFDYTCHQDFLDTYETLTPVPKKFIIDALEVTTIDSSALGMLLLLRNHAGGDNAEIQIINAKVDIYKLMHTCKFDELFEIVALV
jgi:anti-anti-sigma regulatory factor